MGFRVNIDLWKDLANRYKDKIDFLTVYITEAHPSDGWHMDMNNDIQICYRQPKTLKARCDIVRVFAEKENFDVPFVVDTMANEAEARYQAFPERLYIIVDGKLAYCGEKGPWGYHLYEVAAWIVQYLESH